MSNPKANNQHVLARYIRHGARRIPIGQILDFERLRLGTPRLSMPRPWVQENAAGWIPVHLFISTSPAAAGKMVLEGTRVHRVMPVCLTQLLDSLVSRETGGHRQKPREDQRKSDTQIERNRRKPRKPNKRENQKETNYSESRKPKDNPEGY